MIQNNNQTEGRFADYLEYSILPIFDVQIDYNLSLPVSNLIYHSALPKVLDLSDTNLSSYSLLENVANLCKIYLNRNSLWEYVRFTCKYNSEYEIYLSGNHIQKANSVRMFYTTRVLDISHNLLEDLLGSDCEDISHTKILNVSSNMIANIDENFPQIMTLLEELDLSNNPLKNIERYDIGVNAQLRKLILANSDLLRIDIYISSPWNVHLIQLYITSLCEITTRNCPYNGEKLKSYALERWFQRANNLVDPSHINCLKLNIITDTWTCEDDYKLVLNLECTVQKIVDVAYVFVQTIIYLCAYKFIKTMCILKIYVKSLDNKRI
ncbi:hypothetical protein GJ496_005222 [Pomphorhynchus laevis]|nr:hypothetical protein GJ496_005222 [Pomphorhynchus laevis]